MDKQRLELFNFYQSFESPLLNITTEVELDNILAILKEKKIPSFQYIVYCLVKTSMELENFRYRFNGETVYQIKRAIPSYTVLRESGNFNFCTFEYDENLQEFLNRSEQAKEKAQDSEGMIHDDMTHRDYFFLTCLPWYKFTSIQHPVGSFKDATIPSFAVGKYTITENSLSFPLSIQVHHGLVDGIHINQFLELFKQNFNSVYL